MITTFLAFGTIWFWVLVTIVTIAIISFTERDEDQWGSSAFLAVGLVLLYFCGNHDFFNGVGTWIIQNPGNTFLILIGYLVCGSVWSVVKWFFFLKRKRDSLKSYSPNYFTLDEYKVKRQKERILHWMMYWPLSSLWTLVNDPIRKLFEHIISMFGGYYDRLSEKMLGEFVKKNDN